MRTEEFLSRIEGVTGQGPWKGRCPAHEDVNASLSIKQTSDGNTLVKCHAGCSTEAIVNALNLSVSALFERPILNGNAHGHHATAVASSATKNRIASRVEATYLYRDTAGGIVFAVDRMIPKAFRQKRPDGRGGWLWNLSGVEPVPYRLPELLASSGTAFITEGEKDADNLFDIDLTATCNAGGAGKWKPNFADHLEGRSVVVLPDADEPGRKHGEQVAASLVGKASSIKLLTFDGYKDVSDWLAACGTREKLLELVANCPEWVAATKADTTGVLTTQLRTIRLSDIQSKAVRWLWKNIAAYGKLTLWVGDPGQSKSLLSMDFVARATRGDVWPDGTEVGEKCTAIVLNCEDDPEDTIRPRLEAAGADLDRVHFVEASCIVDQRTGKAVEMQFNLQRDVDLLESLIKTIEGPVVIVIDPLGNYLQGKDTHKDAEVREALMPLVEMLKRTGAAAVGVCHLNKSSASSAIYRVGGSIGFVGVARSVWTVTRDPEDRNSPRRLFLPVKANLAPDVGGYAYEIRTAVNGSPYLAWEEGTVSTTAAEALAPPADPVRESPERREVIDWLRDLLEDGPKLSAEVVEAAKAHGHSTGTLKRARTALNVITEKSGFQGQWQMRLPPKEVHTPSSQNW